MKTPMKALLDKYNKLENVNSHTDCAILVTKQFGTKEELETLRTIKAKHLNRGHILQEEIDVRRNISHKYYIALYNAAHAESEILTKNQEK